MPRRSTSPAASSSRSRRVSMTSLTSGMAALMSAKRCEPVNSACSTAPDHLAPISSIAAWKAAEAAGFDFVSIQDHPYVPDFLDTFALIGTLIGQTSRLRFMTNVANLPLRPAQMLAKTSASLDVLSGGRFELGIGAGRAWDQIAGLGGPLRNPREAVAAVSEVPAGTLSPLHANEGAAPMHMSYAEFGKFIEAEIAKWGPVVKQAGMKAE